MTIREVVDKALETGCLNPILSESLIRALEDSHLVEAEDLAALEELMSAVRDGRVVTIERKRCFNIMEEMVWEVLESEYATLKIRGGSLPDVGDVAAHALNHLKPLYAVSEIGADYQRHKARADHGETVRKRVRESLEFSLGRPIWHPDRTPIAPQVNKTSVIKTLNAAIKKPKGR